MSTPSLLTGKWLYRALLKEAQQLPDTQLAPHYLRLIKTAFREPLPLDRSRAYDRTTQAQKLLRRLVAANSGHVHALERALEQGYARKGKASHALLESSRQTKLFTSPALRSLLTSPLSHHARPPSLKKLDTPPTLPPRAFPDSEQALRMGPLIPQRVKAIRKRYWNSQTGKIKKPLAVIVKHRQSDGMGRQALLNRVGLGGFGPALERLGLERLQVLERLAKVDEGGKPKRSRRLRGVTRVTVGEVKEDRFGMSTTLSSPSSSSSGKGKEKEGSAGSNTSEAKKTEKKQIRTTTIPNLSWAKWSTPKVLRPRLMRRRYEALLENAPIVKIEEKEVGSRGRGEGGSKGKGKDKGSTLQGSEGPVRIQVSVSEFAKSGKGRLGRMGEEDTWWVER